MTDLNPLLTIEKEGRSLNILMHFSVHSRGGVITLIGSDSFRDPKTDERYRTMAGTIGFVQIHSQGCSWRYFGDSSEWRYSDRIESFDETKKFAVKKFIRIVRSYLKIRRPQLSKLTREEARQIRVYLRSGIEERMKR